MLVLLGKMTPELLVSGTTQTKRDDHIFRDSKKWEWDRWEEYGRPGLPFSGVSLLLGVPENPIGNFRGNMRFMLSPPEK